MTCINTIHVCNHILSAMSKVFPDTLFCLAGEMCSGNCGRANLPVVLPILYECPSLSAMFLAKTEKRRLIAVLDDINLLTG